MNGLCERGQVDELMRLEVPGAEALFQEGENEYALSSGAMSCWISVDSLSVSLRREQGRLIVQVFPLLAEDKDAITRLVVENPTPF